MDCLRLMYSLLLLVLSLSVGVTTFSLTAHQSADQVLLGDNSIILSCTYTMQTSEQLYYIQLQRKRGGDSDFVVIVTFQNPTSTINVTYQDLSLEVRTTATKPTDSSKTATFMFSSIECNDKATYKWKAFYTDGAAQEEEKNSAFVVKANSLFTTDGLLAYSPNTNLAENDTVVFTCSGDVGNEPVGHLGWFYYLGNDTSQAVNASGSAIPQPPVYMTNTCSYSRISTLQLTMTKEFHNILVRCTAQQYNFNQIGDGHVQTANIPVFYSPRISSISDQVQDEGTASLTLTCDADSHPESTYTWVYPNGTESAGATMQLTSLEIGDTGTYTCVVYNTFKGVNHTLNETTYIDVRKTTTPPPTTSTTPSTGATGGGGSTQPSTGDGGDDDDATTLIIIICVVVAVIVIIAIVVVLVCVKMRKKPKEIEEPPEKPRNNQDLSFYGNRPDLVSSDHGMKNNNIGHNSSFNNSFDSSSDIKPRNEDGLVYIDLSFDDTPRSRRPIQILDNGNTPYADIVNPRV